MNPEFQFIEKETLFFFDERQDCMNCATSLKSFQLDGSYDGHDVFENLQCVGY